VDVLLIPEKMMALVRHNESCSVQKVDLLNTCGTREFKLDTGLLDSMQRSPFTFGTASASGMGGIVRPGSRVGSRNIQQANAISLAAKRATSMRLPQCPNLRGLNRHAFARI